MRRYAIAGVVGTWMVMAILLVQKQQRPAGADLSTLPATAFDEREEWFGVYRGGTKVGHAHRVSARTAGGYAFYEESALALAMLGVRQPLQISLTAETDHAFALRRLRFVLVSPATVFTATGEQDGQRLTVRYGPRGQEATLVLPLTEPIYLPTTLRPRVLASDLTPGARYTVPALNPLTLRNEPFTIVVEGRESLPGPEGPINVVRLLEEHQGIHTRTWLEPSGAVVREEATLGFTLEREPREQALAGMTESDTVDFVAASRIPHTGTIEEPRQTRTLRLRVTGTAASRVPDDPPRQRMTGSVLAVTREDDLVVAVPLTTAGRGVDPTYLAPAPFIESDDPTLLARSRTIVGDTDDATTAARRLVAWVHEQIVKTPSVTVPSAREVLDAGRGDCNEHAVLLAALARAAGLPARVVAGAVYADDGFYYHAWTELWLGRWVSADGVFGQLPADATHIKLIEGGPEQHMALASVIGQLAFAVEEDR